MIRFARIIVILAVAGLPPAFASAAKTSSNKPVGADSAAAATEQRILHLESEVHSLRADLQSEREHRAGSAEGLVNILQVCGWILLIVLAANYLGMYLRVRLLVDKLGKRMQNDIEESRQALTKTVDERFQGNSLKLGKKFRFLEAQINRAFAQAHSDSPMVSFIWWIRAASKLDEQTQAKYLGTSLDRALSALKKISMLPLLRESLQETIEKLNEIGAREHAKQFEIQIKLIREEVERLLRGEPPRTPPKAALPEKK